MDCGNDQIRNDLAFAVKYRLDDLYKNIDWSNYDEDLIDFRNAATEQFNTDPETFLNSGGWQKLVDKYRLEKKIDSKIYIYALQIWAFEEAFELVGLNGENIETDDFLATFKCLNFFYLAGYFCREYHRGYIGQLTDRGGPGCLNSSSDYISGFHLHRLSCLCL